jgi:WD40 repeat protein
VVVSASEDHTLKVWDTATGACRATLAGHHDLVTACAISGQGHVLSGARDGAVLVWSFDGCAVPLGERHWQMVVGCAFLPEGRILTATRDGALWTQHFGSSGPARELGLHGDTVDGLAITPDGTRALSVSRGGTAKLWNVSTRRCELTLQGFSGQPLSCALTPDGRRTVVTFADGRIEVRDLRGQRGSRILAGHDGRVFGCAVTPDGRRVVSVGEDCTLRVSCLDTGECLGVLHGTSWFRCVAVSSEVIAAGDQEGTLWMVSHAPPPAPLHLHPEELSLLRDALARCYADEASARLVVTEAGIDPLRVAWRARTIETWQSIVEEASKQDRLTKLVALAASQYPGVTEILRFSPSLKLPR